YIVSVLSITFPGISNTFSAQALHDSARYFPQPFHTSPLDLSSHRRISKIHNAFLSGKTTTFLLSKKEPATVSLLSSAFSAASPFSIPTSP
ncbi:MAG: hypothetical protein Q3X72_05380, partial [Candidatus Copromonas sp.]|nr:hypothetical protein [Candidatus Copromonas sp.]